MKRILLFLLSLSMVSPFVPPIASTWIVQNAPIVKGWTTPLRMDLSAGTVSSSPMLSNTANLDTVSILLAETEAWVQPVALVMDPLLNFLSAAMLIRVVLSWYPATKLTDFPWIMVTIPTEPLLRAVKGIVPPAFGVDITPVVWLGFFTFVHEILLGQQGLLTLKIKYGI